MTRPVKNTIWLTLILIWFVSGCAPRVREPGWREGVPRIRVGLLVNVPRASVSGTGKVVFYSGGVEKPLSQGKGEQFRISSRGRGIEVSLRDGGGFSAQDTLYISPEADDEFVKLDGKPYRGRFRVFSSSGGLTVVNELNIEDYLKGVVPNEMPSSSEDLAQAVKAQAVAARTYAISRKGRYSDSGFDVLPTVQDQVYSGVSGEKPLSNRSVDETQGIVAEYHGDPIRANYFSTCGGRTSSAAEVWRQSDIPYLRGVKDKDGMRGKAFCGNSPQYRWREVWPVDEFEAILAAFYPQNFPETGKSLAGDVYDVVVKERTKSGRVWKLLVRTTAGDIVLTGDRIRLAIRRPSIHSSILRSTFFKVGVVVRDGRAAEIVMNGGGSGHGVGMCQWGAMGMARKGFGFRQILEHYYHGISLERVY